MTPEVAQTSPPGASLFSLVTNLAILALGIRFHLLHDRDVFAGDARRVFSRALAWGYLVGGVLFWLATLAGSAFLFATGLRSWQASNPAAVLAGLVLIVGYIAVVWAVHVRAQKAAGADAGPIGRLGQFVRLGYGTALPAALRRLRSPH